MNILEKAEELRMKMEEGMDKVSAVDKLHSEASQRFSIASRILSELNRYERRYAFKNEHEETTYFKDHKPEFYARYFYYSRLTQWATAAAFKEPEDLLIFYKEQLREIEIEYSIDADTYHYLLSGESHLHQCYFLNSPIQIDHHRIGITSYETCKGKVIALHQLRQFISSQLNTNPVDRSGFGLKWTGTRTELIELLYALFVNGSFGKNTFKKIVEDFAALFQLDLKNFAQYLVKIKMRKETSQTFFLNTLSALLQERFDKES